jgi:hypothetical protein
MPTLGTKIALSEILLEKSKSPLQDYLFKTGVFSDML